MTECPDKPTLQQYALGRTSEQLSDSVEQHLAECRACDETLAMLDDTADSLLRHLPLAANEMQSPPELEQQPQWLQRLKGGPPGKRNEALDTLDIKPPLQGLESYELLEVLGRGGMGVVYRGRHRQLDRNVAIKIVSPRLVTAGDAAQRFDREIAILGKLQHPGIVMATDAGRVRGAAYLVMELVDGCDLGNLVRRQGPLAVSEACEVARQVAEALAAAHAAGAVHRDVKPSNVMLDRSGRSKLLDFGLARASDIQDHQRETSVGQLLGTLDYMAPEQASGNAVTDSADLFGLGATLFFLLTGRSPRSEKREQTVLQQLQSIANNDAPNLQQLRADIPDELNSLVCRLLSRQPEDRPESASAVAEQLRTFADASAVQAVSSNLPADEPRQDDAVVAQSLSELLGDDILVGMSPAASTAAVPASNGRGGGRSIVRWLVGLGGIMAACYGIIFLLETPEGTLRIESESADIQIELLDEKDLVQKLQIKGGEKETELRAGRYRVRLADGHDGMNISPQNVELTRNGTQVVRITHVKPKSDSEAMSDPNEPLYGGLTRTVWQQRFHAESNLIAKIEAAKALVTLSRKLAVDEQVRMVMSIGNELLTDAEGVNWFESSVVILHTRFVMLTNWNEDIYKGIRQQWDSLFQLMSVELAMRTERELADALARITKDGPSGHAAFAAMLLSDPQLRDHILADVQAGQTIISSATSSTETVDRALLLIRCEMADTTNQHKLVIDDFNDAGRELTVAGAELINDRFPNEWLTYADKINPDRTVWANVSFQMLLHNPQSFAPVSNNEVSRLWAISAVQWLKKHPLEDSRRTAALINQLRWHLFEVDSHVEWPLEEIRNIIVPRIERRYLSTESATSQNVPKMFTQCSMEDHLALLILAGGDLPDCTLAGKPPVTAAKRFELLADCVKRKQTAKAFQKFCEDQQLAGLLADAPVETIRLLMESGPFAESLGMMWYFSNLEVADIMTIDEISRGIPRSRPPVDSLLLIAISTCLSGNSIEQDDHICDTLFCRRNADPRPYDRGYILPAQKHQPAQDITTNLLRKMQVKTSHKLLLTEIDEWLPGEKQKIRLAAEADPRSLKAAVRGYNKETEILRLEFNPAIPDVTLEQLRAGLLVAAEECRTQGKSEGSLKLREAIETGSFGDQCYLRLPKEDVDDNPTGYPHLAPKVYVSTPNTAGQVGHFVIIKSLALSHDLDSYSSKTYGDVPSPIDGKWKLVDVPVFRKDGSAELLTHQPADLRFTVEADTMTFPNLGLEDRAKTRTCILEEHGRGRRIMIGDIELGELFAHKRTIDGDADTITLMLARDPMTLKAFEHKWQLAYKRGDVEPVTIGREGPYLEVYRVKNTSVDEVVKTLVALSLPGVSVVTEDLNAGTIQIQATAPRHEEVAALIRRLDGTAELDSSGNGTPQQPPTELPPSKMQSKPTTSDMPQAQTKLPPSPEFAPVKIRVVDEDGKPVEGAKVKLSLRVKKGQQPIMVEKVSHKDGTAIDRTLPYGTYHIDVNTADGWFVTLLNYEVEFGKPLDLEFVSPAPGVPATLAIEADLDFSDEVRQNLRFGEYRRESSKGAGSFNYYAPEPQQPAKDFKSFPTMANGIDQVAVKILIYVKKEVPQNDKSMLSWTRLINPKVSTTRFWLSNDQIRTVEAVKELRASPENKSGLFAIDTSFGEWVGCSSIKPAKIESAPYSFKVPPGTVEIQLVGIEGRPNVEALEALQLPPQEGCEIWLGTNLETDFEKDSKWIPKLFDAKGWQPGKRGQYPRAMLIKNVVAAPNETVNIKLMTP